MQTGKDLTPYNFVTDLIFHPAHAKPEHQTTSLTISIAIGIFSLGVIPLCVGFCWGVYNIIAWVGGNESKTNKEIREVKTKILEEKESPIKDETTAKIEPIKRDKSITNNTTRIKFNCKEDTGTIKVEEGPGFPNVDTNKKNEVLQETKKKLESYINTTTCALTDEGKGFIQLFKYIKFVGEASNKGQPFIRPGDIIQTPVKMDYDNEFKAYGSKNLFYMHSTPALEARRLLRGEIAGGSEYKKYLDDMEVVIGKALQAQIDSGAEHILWNYFGMGAFLRHVYSDSEEMLKLRSDVADRFVAAFDTVFASVGENKRGKITFYLTGPTGESFSDELKQEPQDNYTTFCRAFQSSKFQKNIIICPETDAFYRGQQIADRYKVDDGEVAPVSVINAADSARLGNKWYHGFRPNTTTQFNANFAIDENAHRRSPLMALTSFLINGGYDAVGKCSSNIERLHTMGN